jgi:hypothetical protein
MGNYKLNEEVAKFFKSLGHETYLLEQLNGNPASDEYIQALIDEEFDLIYFEMLDLETFKVVEKLKGEKILLQASAGVLGEYEKILEYKNTWYNKILTNSLYMAEVFKNNNIPTQHFEYYFSPIQVSEKVFVQQYNNQCSFLGMGFNRLSSPDYELERQLFFRKQEFHFSIYGSGWAGIEHWRGLLPPYDIGKLYTSTKSAIGIIAKGQREKGMINNRYSEIASCGTPIISYNYDTVDWFGGEKFINFISSQEELKEKVKDIITHPDEYVEQKAGLKNFIEIKSTEFFQKLSTFI